MELEVFLSTGQVIRPGESFSDRGADVEQMGLNYKAANKAHVWAKVASEFPKGTMLNIQLVEATITDLSSFRVVEETGELTEADLAVGSYPLWVSINRTDWRFVGLRYVSTGETGGSLTSLLQVEKPNSSKLSFEGRVVYGAGREVPLPAREPVRIG